MTTLIETCAGMAGLTCRSLLGPKARPPTKYLGNKVPYAGEILHILEAPAVRFDRYVLIDPGLPGLVWKTLASPMGIGVVEVLEGWSARKGEDLWHELKTVGLPSSQEELVATWLCLQAGNANSKPVSFRPDATWRTAGYGKLSPSAVKKGFKDRFIVSKVVEDVERIVEALRWVEVDVRICPAQKALDGEDLRDAVVYIDPDYEDTTGYAHTFPRAEVLALAMNCRARGARVGVSETKPLPLDGWSTHLLTRNHWSQPRFSTKQEWLTVSVS